MNNKFKYASIFFLLIVPILLALVFDFNFAETIVISIVIFVAFWILLDLVLTVVALYVFVLAWINKKRK